jgi:hypothetical protein
MNSAMIINDRLHSTHYVYVRDGGDLEDENLLHSLGLFGYRLDDDPQFPLMFAHVARLDDWLAFADDWYCTVYNSGMIQSQVEDLARNHELLRTASGDADNSFEFYHYKHGGLIRAFSFDDWGLTPKGVVRDEGRPFACEELFELKAEPWPYIMSVADELGIDTKRMATARKTYSKEHPKQNKCMQTDISPRRSCDSP